MNKSFNVFNGGASQTILVESSSDPFTLVCEHFFNM